MSATIIGNVVYGGFVLGMLLRDLHKLGWTPRKLIDHFAP